MRVSVYIRKYKDITIRARDIHSGAVAAAIVMAALFLNHCDAEDVLKTLS
jgi:hypothetical protein